MFSFFILLPSRAYLDDFFERIVERRLVSFCHPTFDALVDDDIFSACRFNAYWLHQPEARTLPVPWVYVYVPTKKALGAVVCIAIAFYTMTAVKTYEIFHPSLEFLAHKAPLFL